MSSSPLLAKVKQQVRDRLSYHFLGPPQAIQIEVTNACNLRCKMCPSNSPESETYTRRRTLIEWDLFAKIIDEAATFPRCHIIPQGGGEPFLHGQFREMLSYIKAYPSLTVGFVTNGTKAKADDPALLVDLGVEEVVVSVYGYDAASHKAITGKDNYAAVEGFIHGIAETKAKRQAILPRLRVQAVDVEELRPHRGRLLENWLRVADEVAILAQRDLTGRGLDSISNSRKPQPCVKIWREAAISSDGDIALCCEDWNIDYPLGNITKTSLRDVWFGDFLQNARKQHRCGEFDDLALCKSCYMLWETPPEPVTEDGYTALRGSSATLYRKEWCS